MSEIFCGTTQLSHKNIDGLKENTSGVKLFKIQLSSYHHLVPELIKYLNAAELQRAQKYHFEKDTNQFIICRSLLKFILAQHTSLEIDKINIKIGTNKKPYLSSNQTICFNVSHAKDFAIIVVSTHAVGIDLEELNTNFNFSEILTSVFSNFEIEFILNADDKTYAFYKLWTRKEAIVKATGQGISDDLTHIPATNGHHTVNSKLVDGFKDLKVLSFSLNESYVASIALSGKKSNIDTLLIYNLPKSIKELLFFSGAKKKLLDTYKTTLKNGFKN